MTEEGHWIYYRIFVRNPDDFEQYRILLSNIISPTWEVYQDKISCLYFLNYGGLYKHNGEGGGVREQLPGLRTDSEVKFIRLRIRAINKLAARAIRASLRRRMAEYSDVILGYEVPRIPYNPEEDLGNRFDTTPTETLLSLLMIASMISLHFAIIPEEAIYNSSTLNDGGPHAIVHLVANILNTRIRSAYVVEEFGVSKQSRPLVNLL